MSHPTPAAPLAGPVLAPAAHLAPGKPPQHCIL